MRRKIETESNAESVRRPRLWVISEVYYPEETSTGYYLTRIAEGLADDFEVKVICGQPNYSKRGVVAPPLEVHRGVEIHRAAGTTLNKNVILFRLVNMLTLGLSTFLKAMRLFRKGDRVLVVTNPPTMPFIIAIASLARGGAYTLLIHDNYPEILVAAGKTGPNSLLARSIDFFNRWLYKHAERIIAVGRDMRQLLKAKTDGLEIPIDAIPNWAELETVEPRPRTENALLAEFGLSDKFVFLYAGNMGYPNDLESIVDAADALRNECEIHFIFLGAGVKRPWLENEVGRRNLSNITVLDQRPRSEQPIFLSACDVAIVSLVDNMWGVSVPSRTYNALAAGKPLLGIVEPGSEVDLVINEDRVGWTVPPGCSDDLAAKVRRILADRGELTAMSERARTTATSKYSFEAAIAKYRVVLSPGKSNRNSINVFD